MSRQAVVAAAAAEIGPDNHERRIAYWESALGYEIHDFAEIAKLAWCGGFALYCLHAAGLAKDVHWRIGRGFLLQPPHPLPRVAVPLPGDIGYQNSPFQHHFVVEHVEAGKVHSIDGNQPDVRRKVRAIGPALAFFSIAPLLALAGVSDEPTDPGVPVTLPRHATSAEVQHAVNSLIATRGGQDAPALLTVDGKIGPKSTAAIQWAQRRLGIPVTGNPDSTTCHALGLT